ncbi:MAG: two-component regulator propeller domain-containing protein [Bacteroidota bacterium]
MLDTCPKPIVMDIPSEGTKLYPVSLNGVTTEVVFAAPTIHPISSGKTGGFTFLKNYNSEQDLAFCNITCGISDKRGNLWFGTSGGGVSRYDGKTIINYGTTQGLAGNLIESIIEDKNGNIWFGTNGGGVSKYDGRYFTNYTVIQGLAGNTVNCITEDKAGNLWFCTEKGVSKYNPIKKNEANGTYFTNYTTTDGLVNNSVTCSIESSQGDLWFGTLNGVSRYNGQSFINYSTTEGLAWNNVTCIVQDNSGDIWFGTSGGGVSRYNETIQDKLKKEWFWNYNVTEGLINSNVQSINKDKEGNIWLATAGGVSKYDSATRSFINFTTAQGLANNVVYSIIVDKTGALWLGTNGGGLNKYDVKPFTGFTPEQGLVNDKVWCITEDNDGNIWFGTSQGVSKFNGKSFSNSTLGPITSNIRSLIKDKTGNLWWGSLIGANKYDEKSLTSYTGVQGLLNKGVLSIVEDKKGDLWFGTYGNGVYKFNGKSFTNYTIADGLANNVVKCITEDKQGNIWFGSNGNGISRFDGKSFVNYTTAQGLGNNAVLSSMEDSHGNLWFGTFGGGVSKYDGKSFTNYNKSHGLANDVVYAIVEDTAHGILWCGTNLGLSGLKLDSLFWKTGEVKFEIFNHTTGYPIKDVNTSALFVDSKGILWVGTGDKLVRFDYNDVHKNTDPPIVNIQGLKLHGEPVSWYNLQSEKFNAGVQSFESHNSIDSLAVLNDEIISFGHLLTPSQRIRLREHYNNLQFDSIARSYPLPVNLLLPFQHNNITFDFAAIETDKPQLIRYQYFLEGYDSGWGAITDKASATFGNISEGTYTFKLKAQSPDGIWSEPILYSFRVLPPWYRTWWMYLLYLLAAIAAIALFFRWRTTSLRKEKEILEQTVKKRTTEVVEQKELVEKKNELIEEKQKEIVDSINYAKRIQYTLLANDEVLQHNLQEYFVLFQPKDIVSGDFYWATTIAGSEGQVGNTDRFYLAVCDSTGHGVPGAFMSLLNISFLNEAITEKGIQQPSEILNHVRKRLIENVSQDGAQDGMDGILLCIESVENDDKRKLTYCAANNAPVIVRDNTVIYLPVDKMPVGKGEKTAPFTLHTIDVQKGDMLYLYTDGYADQFGGPKGKKFKYKQLDELLISIHQKPMKTQKELLATAIEGWRGWLASDKDSSILEQVDDILIMGLTIS